ncbi:pentatricopeptide repeat-containing protein At4g02750-like [Selaginella moellendorffii]|uniref:pentatricopeptide repeat-containing protein At4g02750-like n=1 Tax=Selaginella moellendorffii TaxID=88036 RepID=UPI000D1C4E1F|nr:pentatricopeptide repeat-containing protein At4g02750-like [Selaginella moellendorffii]|eukprot:XP_024519912.1 pentatricopeptide repeat-containing protein At4g02750-like [Selaginella moellendorffii]
MLTAHARAGNVKEARLCFERMPHRDVVSWNSMIQAYAQNDCVDEALDLFAKTPEPDLKAMQVFSSIPDKKDVVVWTAMVAAYANNGDMAGARTVLDRIPCRDVPAWNAAITGYALSGYPRQALDLFATIDVEGLRGSEVTYIEVLDACGKHVLYPTRDRDSRRLGCWLLGQRKLDQSWQCVAEHNGHNPEAVELFRVMNVEGVEPDEITFVSLLSACSHGWKQRGGALSRTNETTRELTRLPRTTCV